MNCPKCNKPLEPWPFYDGGFAGVRCVPCKTRWWSDSVDLLLGEAERKAVREAMLTLPFPEDVETEEEHERAYADLVDAPGEVT